MRTITKTVLSVALALILVSRAPQAKADIIYDNLASTTYTPSTGISIIGANIGTPQSWSTTFVAGATGDLGDILLPMWGGPPSLAFDFRIQNSSNTVLESWTGLTAVTTTGGPRPVVDVTSMVHPLLSTGDTYTLTASPNNANTDDAWDIDNTLTVGTVGFRVLSQTATPEPASLSLLGTSLLAFGGFHLRRRRRNPTEV
jgi:hypothetical protein